MAHEVAARAVVQPSGRPRHAPLCLGRQHRLVEERVASGRGRRGRHLRDEPDLGDPHAPHPDRADLHLQDVGQLRLRRPRRHPVDARGDPGLCLEGVVRRRPLGGVAKRVREHGLRGRPADVGQEHRRTLRRVLRVVRLLPIPLVRGSRVQGFLGHLRGHIAVLELRDVGDTADDAERPDFLDPLARHCRDLRRRTPVRPEDGQRRAGRGPGRHRDDGLQRAGVDEHERVRPDRHVGAGRSQCGPAPHPPHRLVRDFAQVGALGAELPKAVDGREAAQDHQGVGEAG
mmetsp:Transcript_86287/g.249016  ORF Transcript_86287/g.249016 Transcript_86287/m.249016 type:complete len:287 (+) Transcript_86287:1982-2842(+)